MPSSHRFIAELRRSLHADHEVALIESTLRAATQRVDADGATVALDGLSEDADRGVVCCGFWAESAHRVRDVLTVANLSALLVDIVTDELVPDELPDWIESTRKPHEAKRPTPDPHPNEP